MHSADWWLAELSARMDSRRTRLAFLRSYLDGDAPLPEGAEGVREAYRQFQKKSRTNIAETITDAVADRMIVSGFVVGDGTGGDDDDARRIWKSNHLGVWSADVHRDMLGLSTGYVTVQPGAAGTAEVVYEKPEQVIVDHDPRRPDRRRAALKIYRDTVEGFDYAYVHLPGVVHRYMRRATDEHGTPIRTYANGWTPAGAGETGMRRVAVVPFPNRGALGEFETHVDILDRINWNILQRLVIIASQAYRQRATKGDLPETDENGNPIDYGELFKPGPGALWQLPEGVDLWESAQADMSGILASSKQDLQDVAGVTRTPLSMLLPEGQNQSAEGASFAKEGLVLKTFDRIERAKVAWSEVLALAFEAERGEGNAPDVDVEFHAPERVSMAERYDALSKVGEAMPWRSRMTDILGIDGDKVDRMEAERAGDMMTAMMSQPLGEPAGPTTAGAPEPAPASVGE